MLLLLLLPSLFWVSLQNVSIFVNEPFEYCHFIYIVLGAFGKLRKPTISCVMSVCPSALNNWMLHFYYISYLCIFRKSVEEIQISSQFDNSNVCKFIVRSLRIPLRVRNVSASSCTQNVSATNCTKMCQSQAVHKMCQPQVVHKMCQPQVVHKNQNTFYVQWLFPKTIFMWGNVEQYGEPETPQMTTIRRMRIACWISKATDIVLIAFPRQQWLRERAPMLRYTFAAWLVPSSLALLGSRLKRYKHSSTLECVLHASSVTLWRLVQYKLRSFLVAAVTPPSPVPSAPRPEPHTQHYRLCVLCFVLHKAEGRLQIVTCVVACVYLEDWGRDKCEDVGRGYGMGGTEGVWLKRLVCVWMYVPMYVCIYECIVYLYIYIYRYVCTYMCTYIRMYVHGCVYMQVCIYICICSARVAQAALPISHAALYLLITLAWLLQPDFDRHIEYIHEGDLRIFPRKLGPSASSVRAYLKSFLDLS
jgi:hypothetical protein